MNPLRTMLSTFCLASALGGVATALAAPAAATDTAPTRHGWHHGFDDDGLRRGPGGGFHRILAQLNLTAAQETQVQSILSQAKPQLQAAHESGVANREQLAVTPPTSPAYPGLLASAKANAAEQIQLMSDVWTQVYAILTPDQQARIPEIVATQRAEREARKEAWRQRRGVE